MDNSSKLRLAVLIDAENVPHSSIGAVMDEVAVHGTPTIKRIYGDWTNQSVIGWKSALLTHAITPVQQYSYTQGKNSSDSAMIIDAMDILYTDKTDGFVLVSSDSDFTRLATRLRESGQYVIGIGESKTPPAFIRACDKFTYIEILRGSNLSRDTKVPDQKNGYPKPTARDSYDSRDARDISDRDHIIIVQPNEKKNVPNDIVQMIAESIADLTDDDAGVFMGELGNLMRRRRPDFDFRNFGFSSLSAMIKHIDRFEVEFHTTSDPNIKHPYVRDKMADRQI